MVVDAAGNPRALVGFSKLRRDPALALFDEAGSVRAILVVEGKEPCLKLCDEAGRGRVRLDVGDSGPGLGLFDEAGKAYRA